MSAKGSWRGALRGEGSRSSTFGSLVLGVYDADKKPVYVGNVGMGFDQALLESLLGKLKKIVVSDASFKCEPYKDRVTWVEPEFVCEVVYMAVTPDLSLSYVLKSLEKETQNSIPEICQYLVQHGKTLILAKNRNFLETSPDPEIRGFCYFFVSCLSMLLFVCWLIMRID